MDKLMKFRLTVLNVCVLIYCIGIFIFSVIYYPTLSSGEGWGIVAMLGLFFIGAVFALIDLFLQLFIKNKDTLNIAGIIVVLLSVGLLLFI